MSITLIRSLAIIIFLLVSLCFLCPISCFYKELNYDAKRTKIVIAIAIMIASLLAVFPMSLNKIINGENKSHRNQYAEMANSLLQGKICIEQEDEILGVELLGSLENPYDMESRNNIGLDYFAWDHAFYNNHLYMYYGIVPAFLVFLPYKMIIGADLTAWKGTAFFEILIIAEFFYLIYFLCLHYNIKLKLGSYLLLAFDLSLISTWYFTSDPGLYSTPISAGMAFTLASLIFALKALWCKEKTIVYSFLTAFFAACVFGCRPNMGMSLIILIPIFIRMIKSQKNKKKRFQIVISCVFPVLIIAILLMYYNKIRFDSIFEFGQSYQLTVADQTNMSNAGIDFIRVLKDIKKYMLNKCPTSDFFPFFSYGGIVFMFPIAWAGCLLLVRTKDRENIVLKDFFFVDVCIILGVTAIVIANSVWSPFYHIRYQMDVTFLIMIFTFIGILQFLYAKPDRPKNAMYIVLYLYSFINTFFLFLMFFVYSDQMYSVNYDITPIKAIFGLN